MLTQPPDTPFTAQMRSLWECIPEDERPTFHDWYANLCRITPISPTPNGIALAAVAFDRALIYWPDFFRPSDIYPVRTWAEILDETVPTATPDMVTAAVDTIAAHHANMSIAHLIAHLRALTAG